MHLRTIQLAGILQRQLNITPGLGAPARQGGETPLPGINVAGRGIKQHQLQLVFLQALFNFPGGILIGEQKLHGFETGAGGGGKAVQERQLGKQHG